MAISKFHLSFLPVCLALFANGSIATVVQYIEQKLLEKSKQHQATLTRLEREVLERPLSDRVVFLPQTPQLRGMNTIIHDVSTSSEDFIFYFDRLACLLLELYAKSLILHSRPTANHSFLC